MTAPVLETGRESVALDGRHDEARPTIALLPWGTVFEDFFDTIGVSFETFRTEFRGSFMFGYAEALARAGVRTLIIFGSARVRRPLRFTHDPSGAAVTVLPAPALYRALRPRVRNPHGRTVEHVFGPLAGARRLAWPILAVLRETILYLCTPPLALARELRREHCCAIVCQEYEYPRFDVCVALGRLVRLPVFATFQAGNYQRSRLEKYSRPLALAACEGVVIAPRTEIARVQSRYGVRSEKIARIFNPVDIDRWHPMDRGEARRQLGFPDTARIAAWHGRVSIQPKGLDVLVEAWRLVCEARPGRDLRLLLVGSGADAKALRQRIDEAGLHGVHWIDEFVHDRERLRRYLSAADVYAFPSRHEGFAVAPLEAMACGLPIVAADAPGVPDILETGEAAGGLMVRRERPVDFADALGRVLDDDAWRVELGRRARRRVEESFSLDAVGRELRAFLVDGAARRATELHGHE